MVLNHFWMVGNLSNSSHGRVYIPSESLSMRRKACRNSLICSWDNASAMLQTGEDDRRVYRSGSLVYSKLCGLSYIYNQLLHWYLNNK